MSAGPNPWSDVTVRTTTVALTIYVALVGALLAVMLAALWVAS